MRALHQLRRDTLEIASQGGGHVTISATHALSFTFFPSWVRGNQALLALGNLNLVSDSMQACEQMMQRGDAQFLLCHHHGRMKSSLDRRQFRSIVVGIDTLVPLCAPDERGRPQWPLRADKPARFLAYSAQSGLGRILSAVLIGEVPGLVLEKTFTSHLAATLLSMARAGDGLAWLPRTLAEDDIKAGRLVKSGNRKHEIPLEIRLFRPVLRQSPAVETVWSTFEAQ
jgi:DNA-binding transcriptional LysR family regulator